MYIKYQLSLKQIKIHQNNWLILMSSLEARNQRGLKFISFIIPVNMKNMQSHQAADECKLNIITVKKVIYYFQILGPMNILRYIYWGRKLTYYRNFSHMTSSWKDNYNQKHEKLN